MEPFFKTSHGEKTSCKGPEVEVIWISEVFRSRIRKLQVELPKFGLDIEALWYTGVLQMCDPKFRSYGSLKFSD